MRRHYTNLKLGMSAKQAGIWSPATERARETKAPVEPDPYRRPPENMPARAGCWRNGKAMIDRVAVL